MEPKEKAKKLYSKFLNYSEGSNEDWNTKQCALICIEEIISQWEYIDTYLADLNGELNPNLKYWYNVKEELEKL